MHFVRIGMVGYKWLEIKRGMLKTPNVRSIRQSTKIRFPNVPEFMAVAQSLTETLRGYIEIWSLVKFYIWRFLRPIYHGKYVHPGHYHRAFKVLYFRNVLASSFPIHLRHCLIALTPTFLQNKTRLGLLHHDTIGLY